MCINFIDTFNELKVLHKCKLWWGGSLNERNSTNVPLSRTSSSPTWDICFYTYKIIIDNWLMIIKYKIQTFMSLVHKNRKVLQQRK